MSSRKMDGRIGWHVQSRRIVNIGIACCITYLLASIAHSHYVVGQIKLLGVSVPFADQLRMTLGDLVGLYAYAAVIAAGMVTSCTVMAGVRRLSGVSRWVVYPLGGILAMGTIMVAISLLFPMTVIAPARHLSGIVWQCSAGFMGGIAFAWLQVRTACSIDKL